MKKSKSQFLDELRMEVGLAYDYSSNKEEFLEKVLRTIYHAGVNHCILAVYSPMTNGGFKREFVLGETMARKGKRFGFGFISLCSFRGTVLMKKNGNQIILAPIYEEEKLAYVISLNISASAYLITQQDIDFINELVKFIEMKRMAFIEEEEEA
ncbi:hypothetical protein QA612_18635 [Evansella sp. AB-P1]|uniref:hypothetical protein n=1 Tax=Evansella sp. AB-P1 TaxID=3037653 RepID=UPI00241EACC3|nr:hypothetical protein [Evansella sp. AB-P1]MDG5789479.1 hypothetical protein [Evansella sp. AB-P1]